MHSALQGVNLELALIECYERMEAIGRCLPYIL